MVDEKIIDGMLEEATDEEVAEAFEATIEAELDEMMEEINNTELTPEAEEEIRAFMNAKTPEERKEVMDKYYPDGMIF